MTPYTINCTDCWNGKLNTVLCWPCGRWWSREINEWHYNSERNVAREESKVE